VMSVVGQMGLSYLGPNVLRITDKMLAVYLAAGFDSEEAIRAMGTVHSYVLGSTSGEVSWLKGLKRANLREDGWLAAMTNTLEQAVKDYPRLMGAYNLSQDQDVEAARHANFAYGLERVLDGVEVHLTTRLAGESSARRAKVSGT
jgi:hypothetical protein